MEYCARGTSRAGSLVRPPCFVADADVPRGQIHNRGRNKKWRDLTRSTIKQIYMLALDHVEPADSRSDMHAGAGGNLFGDLQA